MNLSLLIIYICFCVYLKQTNGRLYTEVDRRLSTIQLNALTFWNSSTFRNNKKFDERFTHLFLVAFYSTEELASYDLFSGGIFNIIQGKSYVCWLYRTLFSHLFRCFFQMPTILESETMTSARMRLTSMSSHCAIRRKRSKNEIIGFQDHAKRVNSPFVKNNGTLFQFHLNFIQKFFTFAKIRT